MKLTALLSLGLLALSPGLVFAQAAKSAAPAAVDENVTYKAKTTYDFEDDNVEGDLQRPDGELVNTVRKTKHSSLIEIRQDFIPEMLKALEDV